MHDRANEILSFIAIELTLIIWEALYYDEEKTQILEAQSVQFSALVMSNSLQPHGLQHAAP